MAMTDPSPCHILETFPQMPCLLREQVKAPWQQDTFWTHYHVCPVLLEMNYMTQHPPQHDATLNSHQHISRRGTCIGGNISPFTQSVKVINLPATSMKSAGRWWWLATSPMGSWIYKIPRHLRGWDLGWRLQSLTIKQRWNKKRQSSNSNMPIIWTRNKNFLSWEYLH